MGRSRIRIRKKPEKTTHKSHWKKKIKQLKTVTKIISTETNAFKGISSHPGWWLLLRLFR
jgi:hypothetical protein